MVRLNLLLFKLGILIMFEIPGYSMRDDIHVMMYKNFDNPMSCFRRLNGSQQFGCSTPRKGTFGVIYHMKTASDLNAFEANATSGPYMIAIEPKAFTLNVMNKLAENENIAGILLLVKSNNRPTFYSPDDVCPNRYSGDETCSDDSPWNPDGSSFLFRNWPMPIFTVKSPATIKTILDCHDKFNVPLDESQHGKALCSLHMMSHMFAAVDSETCIRRTARVSINPMRYCDPLGDQNIFLSMGNNEFISEKDVIVVSARYDSASLFDGISPGAMSSVSGLVTLLTTARLLFSMLPPNKIYNKTVAFILFNGEAFDYIGSSKVVYDMDRNQFPIPENALSLERIKLFIDISQLDKSSTLFAHHYQDEATQTFVSELSDAGNKVGLDIQDSPSSSIPPSSYQIFHKANNSLPGLVLTNFKKKFVNRYYHGLFDTAENLDFKYSYGSSISNGTIQYNLAAIASTLAVTLYKMVTNEETTHVLEQELVDELLYCYLLNSNCKKMQAILSGEGDTDSKPPLPLYVGVKSNVNRVTQLTGFLLAYLASPSVNLSDENCASMDDSNKIYSYIWVNGENGTGECLNSTLKFTPAYSPAFDIENYNWTSGEYSTWTESVWQKISLRMFLRPSRKQELITLGSGLTTMVISFIAVYWIKLGSSKIFSAQCPVNC